jgi:heptosyltransferase-1
VRIILVRLSALGDIVHTWPLACALAETETGPHLSWVVEESLRPLVDGHPAVDAVFTVRTGRWRRQPFSTVTRSEVAAFKTRLRELDPDLVIDPQGTAKSAMVVRWSRAARKVGLARPWRRELLAGLAHDDTVPGAPGSAHVVATNLAMVRAVSEDLPDFVHPDGSWLLDRCAHRAPSGPWASRHAVLLPGTGGAHKFLATSTLAEVARGLKANGFDVIVVWGPGEEERATEVVEAAGEGIWLAPSTDLEELAAMLGGAALVIGGDTGPVHLAASFGTPTLAVFVASDWRRNGPLGARTAVVSGAEEGRTAPSGTARTRRHREIGAAEILKSARELIEH